jgi:hypothetical protein
VHAQGALLCRIWVDDDQVALLVAATLEQPFHELRISVGTKRVKRKRNQKGQKKGKKRKTVETEPFSGKTQLKKRRWRRRRRKMMRGGGGEDN